MKLSLSVAGPLYPDEDEDLADSVLAASLAEHEEKDFWEQGMDEEEDEQAELRQVLHTVCSVSCML